SAGGGRVGKRRIHVLQEYVQLNVRAIAATARVVDRAGHGKRTDRAARGGDRGRSIPRRNLRDSRSLPSESRSVRHREQAHRRLRGGCTQIGGLRHGWRRKRHRKRIVAPFGEVVLEE